MNDASPTGPDHPPPSNAPITASHGEVSTDIAEQHAPNTGQKKRAQRDQKTAMLDNLIRNIDIVIYAQLSVLYYMDCSLLYFLLRALPHWFYFSPKPSIFPPPPLTHRPYIGIIFGTNILCILLHIIFASPAAGEATRGYLHGGLLIDFVGQKSPVGRWRLIDFDLLVLALQVLMLGVTLERRTIATDGGRSGNVEEVTQEQGQDHDSEERGMLRGLHRDSSVVEDIEMQDLHQNSTPSAGNAQRDQDELWRNSSETDTHHPLDPFYTGEIVLANLDLLDTIRAQWQASGVRAEGTNASASGVQAAVVAAAAGRTLTYRLNQGIQNSE